MKQLGRELAAIRRDLPQLEEKIDALAAVPRPQSAAMPRAHPWRGPLVRLCDRALAAVAIYFTLVAFLVGGDLTAPGFSEAARSDT